MDKRSKEREAEAKRNRKKYKHWKNVLREPVMMNCGGCGKRVRIQGDVTGKSCLDCGTPLNNAR